eukprot:2043488-Amphidinium_carterae.1
MNPSMKEERALQTTRGQNQVHVMQFARMVRASSACEAHACAPIVNTCPHKNCARAFVMV